ncbi:MAG: hypothetical protein ACQESR_06945 [Planctomycetota bacterium]
MESCPTQAVLPLVGLAAEKTIHDRYINSKCKRFTSFERPRRWKSPGFRSCRGGSNWNP